MSFLHDALYYVGPIPDALCSHAISRSFSGQRTSVRFVNGCPDLSHFLNMYEIMDGNYVVYSQLMDDGDFMLKLFWILYVRVPVAGDYKVFWEVANALMQQEEIHNRYVALFPHILGYSSFLSFFLAWLGPLPLLPQVLNVFLTLCTGTALFCLCRTWCSLESGVAAYLLWTLCPSQTIYNSLILSEPLYTALILGFFLVITHAEAFEPGKWGPVPFGGHSGGDLRSASSRYSNPPANCRSTVDCTGTVARAAVC